MVGLRRFELPTSPTPRERATSLRHSPTLLKLRRDKPGNTKVFNRVSILKNFKLIQGWPLWIWMGKHAIIVSTCGPIAQLVERYDGIVEASGSTPLGSTSSNSGVLGTDRCVSLFLKNGIFLFWKEYFPVFFFEIFKFTLFERAFIYAILYCFI